MHEDESYFLPRGFEAVKRVSLEDIHDERAWLVFRTELRGQEKLLLDKLEGQGYRICPTAPARFGRTEVHRIEIVKGDYKCRD